jgi:hypothetical protein
VQKEFSTIKSSKDESEAERSRLASHVTELEVRPLSACCASTSDSLTSVRDVIGCLIVWQKSLEEMRQTHIEDEKQILECANVSRTLKVDAVRPHIALHNSIWDDERAATRFSDPCYQMCFVLLTKVEFF